jgi:hypothetical protein
MRPCTIDDEDSANENEAEYEPESEEEEEYIGEGECELFEHFLKLTKHHLIPKLTWTRIKTKLLRAAAAIDKRDPDQAKRILGLFVFIYSPTNFEVHTHAKLTLCHTAGISHMSYSHGKPSPLAGCFKGSSSSFTLDVGVYGVSTES